MIDSNGAIARSKRSPSEDENGFAPPPAPYLPKYSSPIYPTKSDKLFTNRAILMEAISGKKGGEKPHLQTIKVYHQQNVRVLANVAVERKE